MWVIPCIVPWISGHSLLGEESPAKEQPYFLPAEAKKITFTFSSLSEVGWLVPPPKFDTSGHAKACLSAGDSIPKLGGEICSEQYMVVGGGTTGATVRTAWVQES